MRFEQISLQTNVRESSRREGSMEGRGKKDSFQREQELDRRYEGLWERGEFALSMYMYMEEIKDQSPAQITDELTTMVEEKFPVPPEIVERREYFKIIHSLNLHRDLLGEQPSQEDLLEIEELEGAAADLEHFGVGDVEDSVLEVEEFRKKALRVVKSIATARARAQEFEVLDRKALEERVQEECAMRSEFLGALKIESIDVNGLHVDVVADLAEQAHRNGVENTTRGRHYFNSPISVVASQLSDREASKTFNHEHGHNYFEILRFAVNDLHRPVVRANNTGRASARKTPNESVDEDSPVRGELSEEDRRKKIKSIKKAFWDAQHNLHEELLVELNGSGQNRQTRSMEIYFLEYLKVITESEDKLKDIGISPDTLKSDMQESLNNMIQVYASIMYIAQKCGVEPETRGLIAITDSKKLARVLSVLAHKVGRPQATLLSAARSLESPIVFEDSKNIYKDTKYNFLQLFKRVKEVSYVKGEARDFRSPEQWISDVPFLQNVLDVLESGGLTEREIADVSEKIHIQKDLSLSLGSVPENLRGEVKELLGRITDYGFLPELRGRVDGL